MDIFVEAPHKGSEQGEWLLMTNAVVFVLTQYLARDADRCIQHCVAHGYTMIGLIKDDWKAAMALALEGKASVIVAASPAHVDPDREPRVEFVAYDSPRPTSSAPGISQRETRTRIIRRSGGA